MTIGHALYIPLVLLIGLAFGYAFGAKAVRREYDEAQKRARQ
jgi:hypothetical protein